MSGTAARGGPAGRLPLLAGGLGALALLAWAAVAVAGPSAAAPGLGPGRVPFDLGLRPSSALVSALLATTCLAGGAAALTGLAAVGRGWRPAPRLVLRAGLGAAVVVCLLPPVGSADHLSYAAYGRIAALGGDPYTASPAAFAGGQDPVASAVRDPWRETPSVYGPVATLLHALASLAGGDSVRATVWAGQLVLLAAWAAAAVGLERALRHDDAARARAAVLWTLNPLLLTVGLGGAHADVLAGAAALGALLLAPRAPLAAGLVLGVAAGTKLPYAAAGAGLLVAHVLLRRAGWGPGWLLRGVAGALLVLVPAHLWAGAHAYDQTRTASRYVSLATVWRPLVDAGLPRGALLPGTLVLAALLVAVHARRLAGTATTLEPDDELRRTAAGATCLLALGYLLAAPYALPWYDLLLWGPLALAVTAPAALDRLLLVRLSLLALAYVPGLVDGMSPAVEALTLGYRREVGPWLAWVWLLAALALPPLLARRRRTSTSR
ncbi:polyprenol phosphomannose-dependent alpha 1,6 mannosyltransferase MptB [Kineococcus sp. SYSU DK004]|uniref:polyprenol phosphomannose-dependent alpha 1,6 mannosyltransferase MptB n=1 Tax=Kineococcus sp. SYSU DK004 TaxID=3383125 RepID=UPI003D7E5228